MKKKDGQAIGEFSEEEGPLLMKVPVMVTQQEVEACLIPKANSVSAFVCITIITGQHKDSVANKRRKCSHYTKISSKKQN